MKKRVAIVLIPLALLVGACTQTDAGRNPKPPCHPCKSPVPTVWII